MHKYTYIYLKYLQYSSQTTTKGQLQIVLWVVTLWCTFGLLASAIGHCPNPFRSISTCCKLCIQQACGAFTASNIMHREKLCSYYQSVV